MTTPGPPGPRAEVQTEEPSSDGSMTDTPPAPEPRKKSWTRSFGIGALGVAGIIGARFLLTYLAFTMTPADTFADDATVELGADTVRTLSYEIHSEQATLSYRTAGATGPFSLFLLPEAQSESFFAGGPFDAVKGHAFVDIEGSVAGAVMLPRGTYAFATACAAQAGCRIPLHVEITDEPSAPAPSLELVSTDLYGDAPYVLWDDASYVLQPYEIIDDPEFYSTMAGTLAIDATSNQPLRVCLLTAEAFDAWFNTGVDPVDGCEPTANEVSANVDIVPHDYALFVECLARAGDQCRVKLDVVFVPGVADDGPETPAAA